MYIVGHHYTSNIVQVQNKKVWLYGVFVFNYNNIVVYLHYNVISMSLARDFNFFHWTDNRQTDKHKLDT